MKLQQLFAGQDIDWKRTKLIRHNLTNEIVAGNYAAGLLDVYQSVQTRTRFQGCDTIISFLGTERTNGVYQGCFRVVGSVPFNKSLLPENFVFDSGMDDNCAIYQLEPLAILSDLKDRLVIDWGAARSTGVKMAQQRKRYLKSDLLNRKYALRAMKMLSCLLIPCIP